MQPLNSGHLRVLKNFSVIKRCPLLGSSLTEIITFGTKHFVRHFGCPLFGGFTVMAVKFKVYIDISGIRYF